MLSPDFIDDTKEKPGGDPVSRAKHFGETADDLVLPCFTDGCA